jgi:glycosyltransferase involved in cell wall biosynthesis
MRVLHVIPSLDPADGGPPQVAVKLAEAQARLGHEVRLLHLRPPAHRLEAVAGLVQSPPGELRSVVESIERPRGLIARLGAWRGRIASQRPHIVHIHGVWEPEVVAAARECRRHQLPYVIETFGTLNPWSLEQRRLKKLFFLAILHGRMLQQSCFLHALNPQEAGHLEALRLGTSVEVFPNGIFVEEFRAADTVAARRSVPGLGGAPFVLFMARLHPMKGLDLLADAFIDAAGRVGDAHLVVAGPRDAGADDFERRIASAGIGHRVHLVGEIAGDRKHGLLQAASVFAQPSRNEGFSVSILEALASGRPVVITPECNFPEVADSDAGMVVPFEVNAVSGAIQKLLTDREANASMGRNARSLVQRDYTWEAIASKSIDAYRRGIERSASRR